MLDRGQVKRWRALDYLAKAGGPDVETFLEDQAFSTGPSSVRTEALTALAGLRKEKSIPLLLRARQDKDPAVSRIGTLGLLSCGDEGQKKMAYDLLVQDLNREQTRLSAAECLMRAGCPVPASLLVDTLKTTDRLQQRFARWTIRESKDPDMVRQLENLARDPRYGPQAVAALNAVDFDKCEGSEDTVLAAFDSSPRDLRLGMASVLGRSGTGKSPARLQRLLSDDPESRSSSRIEEAIRGVLVREGEARVKALRQRRANAGAKLDLVDDDLYFLAIFHACKSSGEDRDFATTLLDEHVPRSTRAVLRCLADYPFEWYPHDPRDRLFARLTHFAGPSSGEIVQFLDGPANRGKVLALAALARLDYEPREPDPLDAVQGLLQALTRCAGNPEYRLRVEARRVLAVLAAEPKDRPLAKALDDLGYPHYRGKALEWLSGNEGVANLAGDKRERLIEGLVESLWSLAGEAPESCRFDQAIEFVKKLDDARFVAPVRAYLERYDPEAEEPFGIGIIDVEPVNKARDFLLRHGVKVRRLNDGRFGFDE